MPVPKHAPPPPSPPHSLHQAVPPPSPARPHVSLQQPSQKKSPWKPSKLFKSFRHVFRSFPIITPNACKFPAGGRPVDGPHIHGGTRMTGTLFGCRRSRINLAIQENSRCIPMLVLELSTPTGKLLQEMGLGLVRIALECEKHHPADHKTKLMDEPIWTMYCNGRKTGYGVKREATADDLNVMEMLHATSMGAGVLPSDDTATDQGELTYMRGYFERVVGSKDSETYYMMNPDGNTGPELSIFFVRV
ncbi:hypothetical protein RJ640_015219 [Escallonia rubra]|uniref:Protein MIZU-KUSSEI 1 n=1 Tax=Escallonia rubra TaxID=112253 RepID=A0AA88QU96_9ASTE|nr:hypothetical protein RJ640_015221 [Escallonia rubra]KAK2975012.1 hypothetical protein RJ640_000218 [Escallonia rubra]KAK2989887.1 hypothetical protein RJ640_015219 [Escallonia rubra]